MLTALEEAFDGMDSECLVIIYYIGRGEVRHQLGDAQLWMQGRQQTNEQMPEINLNMVQETAIDHQPSKVLMLLDTCHGAGGSIGHYKEIIGACYAEHRATPGGFTDHLVGGLTQAACAKNLLTTAQLWTNLARRYVTANNMELANIPWLIAEFEENRTAISIKPIDLTDWSPAPSLSFVGSSQEFKVLLSVHLGNLSQQTDWDIQARIEQNPLIPSRTRVHNIYRSSPSTAILIVSITLEIWYSLQNHPAVKFLGFQVHKICM